MGAIYYHLCPARLGAGSIIEPGNFGHIVSLYGYKHNHFGREAVLERTRIAFAPDAPSRLNCVFGFLTQADANAFRFREHQNGFATHYLYEVEPTDAGASIAVVPLDALERWDFNEADERASLYWSRSQSPSHGSVTVGPGVPESAGFYEVLLASPVRVLRRIN